MSYVTQWSFTTDCRSSDKAQGTKPIGLLLNSSPRCLPLGIVHCLHVCGGLGIFRVPFHQCMHCRFRWRWLLTSQANAHSGVYNIYNVAVCVCLKLKTFSVFVFFRLWRQIGELDDIILRSCRGQVQKRVGHCVLSVWSHAAQRWKRHLFPAWVRHIRPMARPVRSPWHERDTDESCRCIPSRPHHLSSRCDQLWTVQAFGLGTTQLLGATGICDVLRWVVKNMQGLLWKLWNGKLMNGHARFRSPWITHYFWEKFLWKVEEFKVKNAIEKKEKDSHADFSASQRRSSKIHTPARGTGDSKNSSLSAEGLSFFFAPRSTHANKSFSRRWWAV